jgi:hypothetical protein
MFTKPKNESSKLDEIIDEVETYILSISPNDEEYSDLVDHLSKLYKIREQESSEKKISANTKAIIIANLAGIVMILGFEKAHVVTSKALSFIVKLK